MVSGENSPSFVVPVAIPRDARVIRSREANMEVSRNVRHTCVMAREDSYFRLRLPAGLKARVEAAADASGQSINAEIVQRLEEAFSTQQDATLVAVSEVLRALAEMEPDQAAALLEKVRRQDPKLRTKI